MNDELGINLNDELGLRIAVSKKHAAYEKLLKNLEEEHINLIIQLELNDALQEALRIKIGLEKENV